MTMTDGRTSFAMRYLAGPENVGPTSSCNRCEHGEVWFDGLVPGFAEQDGWKPVCDDCLEREHPALLEAVRWQLALCRIIDEHCVTPAAIDDDKRAWMARVHGPDAAAAMTAEDLPDLAAWHSDELALTILLA